jgi:WD40 repeat protein/DNA-binding SARP family transcriptional activator
MTGMEFCLLGPLVVRSGGAEVPVPRGKPRAVLAALLLNAGRVVSVDELAETLWGDELPPSARVTVQNYVRRLRNALEESLGESGRSRIITREPGYMIRAEAGELDVTRFEACLRAAQAAAQDGSWETAASQARAALALWRDEPLADVDSETLTLRERPRLEKLAEMRLQALETRLDADLHLGRHAEVIAELRYLTGAHRWREDLHGLLMLALYLDGRQADALEAYQHARQVLDEELGIEPGPELQELQKRILNADPSLVRTAGMPSPYRGLSGFGEDDAALFFGRDKAAADVLGLMSQCLEGAGLVVVSGASGAGKSSLVRAGVLPRLREAGLEAAPAAAAWPCVVLAPGRAPLKKLAPLAGVAPDLADDPVSLALTARQAFARMPGGARADETGQQRVLIIVDQAEQLFTQCPAGRQRQAFLAALHAAAAAGHALVVLVVRADFEARLAEYPPLAEAVQHRYLLTAMTDRQLQLAIAEPAIAAGSRVDDDLVQAVLQEAGAGAGTSSLVRAGVLPLLSHALDQAWRSRTGPALTRADYGRTGGIEGAVAASAESAYAQLTPARQAIARQVFTRLTATSADGVVTAARLTRADLAAGHDAAATAEIDAVLEAFARERLLTLAADGPDDVEISHEALLTAWPRLRDTWLAETQADRITRTRLRNDAAEWSRTSRDPSSRDRSYLYTGRLLHAAETAARSQADPGRLPPLTSTERDFLHAAHRAASRRRRRRRTLIGSISVLAVGALVASTAAIRLGHDSAASIARTRSEQLAAGANAVRSSDPGLASQLAVAAYREAATTEARSSLLTSLTSTDNVTAATLGKPVLAVAASPAGNTVAVTTAHAERLWNLAATSRPVPETTIHTAGSVAAAFAPGGQLMAAGCPRAGLCLWNVADTRHPILAATLPGAPVGAYPSVAVSSDGTLLAAADKGGVTRVWNIATPSRPRLLTTLPITPKPGAPGRLGAVAFQPDGAVLATTRSGDATRLWDMSDPAHPRLLSVIHTGYDTLAFSPDGTKLAAARPVAGIGLWDVSTATRPTALRTPDLTLTQGPTSVSFSPDGNTLAVGGTSTTGPPSGELSLLDLKTHSETDFPVDSTIYASSLAYEPDGMLVTGEGGGTVSLWGRPMPELPTGSDTDCADECVFSPNGDLLLLPAPGIDGGADLWDVSHPGHPRLDAELAAPYVVSARFLSDTVLVLTGVGTRVTYPVSLWDVSDPRHPRRGTFLGGAAVGTDVSANAAGDLLAVPGGDGVLRLWHVASAYHATMLGSIPDPQPSSGLNGAPDAAITPDGHTVFVSSTTGFRLWDVSDPRHPVAGNSESLPMTGPISSPYTIGYQGNGAVSTLYAENAPSQEFWAVANGHVEATRLLTGQQLISSVSFSADGRLLAATGVDGALMLWDTSDPTQPRNLGTALTPAATSDHLAISADDTLLAGAGDTSLQLWDISNPYLPTLAATADLDVSSLAFAQPGHTLALDVSNSNSNAVYLLDTDPAAAASQLCGFTGETITRAQWAQYAPGVPYQPPCP